MDPLRQIICGAYINANTYTLIHRRWRYQFYQYRFVDFVIAKMDDDNNDDNDDEDDDDDDNKNYTILAYVYS